jgi:hypothetical protein
MGVLMSLMNKVRISTELAGFDWLIVVSALDAYMIEHEGQMDFLDLIEFVEHIESRVQE